jgi:hypothetical protein
MMAMGFISIAGSSDCNSSDFGSSWACRPPVDSSGIDSAIACAGSMCLVGGGEISPAVAGWVHLSTDGGLSWGQNRALNATFPIRTVQVLNIDGGSSPFLIAAGGNVFSSVGGIYSSSDGGETWELFEIGEEVKACRTLPLVGRNATRIICVSAGTSSGGIYVTDVPVTVS